MSELSSNAMPPLTLVLEDKPALKTHYLPFLKRGGLFVPTHRALRPNETVQFYLQLLAAEPLLITGTLAWRTPAGAQNQKIAGVGVHFSDADAGLKSKIEALLADFPDNDKPSHTL